MAFMVATVMLVSGEQSGEIITIIVMVALVVAIITIVKHCNLFLVTNMSG